MITSSDMLSLLRRTPDEAKSLLVFIQDHNNIYKQEKTDPDNTPYNSALTEQLDPDVHRSSYIKVCRIARALIS